MELKDEWAKLEPRAFQAEQLAKKANQEAKAALADIAHAFKKFQDNTKS
jgi:hypothetical protein